MPQQDLQFLGTGIDRDSFLSTMPYGNSPFRLNCRYHTTQDSYFGNIEKFNGNTKIVNNLRGEPFEQPLGRNKMIGWCNDFERNAIIYFVWNEYGIHQIRRYYTVEKAIEVVLQTHLLRFREDVKINHANVIDDTLSWTFRYENKDVPFDYVPPQQISLSKAVGYTQGQPFPIGYTSIDFQVLSAAKYPPLICPTFVFLDLPLVTQNFLYGHLFQFSYRYVYFDNSKSLLAPFSKLTLPQGEDIEGKYSQTVENALDVTVETGHFTVTKIELIVRIGNFFKVVDVVDKYELSIPSDSTYTFRFFNDKVIEDIPSEVALLTNNYVPQIAGAQEVVSASDVSQRSNVRVYGDITEGYDNIVVDLVPTVKYEKIDPTDVNYKNISFKRRGAYQLGVVYRDEAGRVSFVQANEASKFNVAWWRDDQVLSPYYDPADEWILSTHQKPYVEWALNSDPPVWATSYEIVCTKDINTGEKEVNFFAFGAMIGEKEFGRRNIKPLNTIKVPSNVGYDFTDGDRIRLILAFDESDNQNVKDFGMEATLNTANPVENPKKLGVQPVLVTPTPAFPYQVNLLKTTPYYIDYTIKSYDSQTGRVVINGEFPDLNNSEMYMLQIVTQVQINDNPLFYEIGETYKIVNGEHSVTTGRLEGIDCFVGNRLVNIKPQAFSAYISLFLESNQGQDVLGEVHIQDFNGYNDTNFVFNTFAGVSLFPRITSLMYVANVVEHQGLNGVTNAYQYSTAYFTGAFPDNLFKFFVKVNFSSHCSGQSNGGPNSTASFDVPIADFKIKNLIFETDNYSPYYSSYVDQTGKPYTQDKLAKRRRNFANVRWGGTYNDNTQLNYFSDYAALAYLPLQESFNEINKLRTIGFTLKVRQRNKITSIYIGRTELVDTTGQSSLQKNQSVLGTVNPSDEVWGCQYAETDTISIRDTYFFDVLNGVVIRDSNNGQRCISGDKESPNDTFKMTSYFRALGEMLNGNPLMEMCSGYDKNTESYYLTIKQKSTSKSSPFPQYPSIVGDELQKGYPKTVPLAHGQFEEIILNRGLTLSFHEPSNRWQTWHSFVPEGFASQGNTFLSFQEGECWLHHSNEVKTNYYDIQFPLQNIVVSNVGANTIKVWDNLDVYSNLVPDAPSIYILPTATYPIGMSSYLKAGMFTSKEGVWHSRIQSDQNDPNFPNPVLAWKNGRVMRGEHIAILLDYPDGQALWLRSVSVHFTPSELTGTYNQ